VEEHHSLVECHRDPVQLERDLVGIDARVEFSRADRDLGVCGKNAR
jgi:hypothetical protein